MLNEDKKQLGVTPQEFKDTMACFATGVTLVTTQNVEGEPAGLIVTTFASVSLNPPLVMFSLAKSSQLHDVFAISTNFAVNILNSGQDWLVKQFTSPVPDRWLGVDYEMARGAPLIQDSLAQVECTVAARHNAGDHTIYVGHVDSLLKGEGEPLLYYQRQFGEFS